MRAISSSVVRAIPVGARLKVADNSKATIVKVIAVVGYKGTRRRLPSAGVGDMVVVSVQKGDYELLGKVLKAVIIRQRKEYRRLNGMRVKFEDNACIILKDDYGTPAGTVVKGPVAKEAVERFPDISKIATIIV